MIEVRELRKNYGELCAVDGVSFAVPQGECFGLLGPNGAGKTTTISMLTGILPPDSGEVHVNGEADPTRPQVRRNIGTVPQSLAIYEELTGQENLHFFGKLYGLKGKELHRRIDETLDLTGLTDRKNDRAGTYSGGMKRRLNIACSMLHEPKILFFDEPTVGVDPQSRNLIFDNIELLKSRGTTIVYTTHYMEEAERLCDRVGIVDHGKLLAIDTIEGLVANHGGLSSIELELASIPENSEGIPGTLEGNVLLIETEKPFEEVARLGNLGLQFLRLEIRRASLETVFLNLTGRRLRD